MKLRNFTLLFLLSIILLFSGCKKKINEPTIVDETLFFFNPDQELSQEIKSKFPDWIKKDVECYSYAKLLNDKQNVSAYPIKCKITGILRSGVKCRVIENTSYFDELQCGRYDVKTGTIWFETKGDLFLTKEEAIAKIKQQGYFLMDTEAQ